MKLYRVYYTAQSVTGLTRLVWHGYAHSALALYEAFEAYMDVSVVEE